MSILGHGKLVLNIYPWGTVALPVEVVVLWPVFCMFVVLVQIPGTQNGHEWVSKSMKSRFEPTKFEETTMQNTISISRGPFWARKGRK